jgi:hypothetical protein
MGVCVGDDFVVQERVVMGSEQTKSNMYLVESLPQ